jgi:hypothetical protein
MQRPREVAFNKLGTFPGPVCNRNTIAKNTIFQVIEPHYGTKCYWKMAGIT